MIGSLRTFPVDWGGVRGRQCRDPIRGATCGESYMLPCVGHGIFFVYRFSCMYRTGIVWGTLYDWYHGEWIV